MGLSLEKNLIPISRRTFLGASAFGAVGFAFADANERFPFFEPVDPPRRVQAIAHRGWAKIAPENSRRALEACERDFIEWAEIDVRRSKDGQHVVFHDDQLDSKTDGQGAVESHTLTELKQLDAGTWFASRFARNRILSLSEALRLAKGKLNLYLDCKNVDPLQLVQEVRSTEMERQVIVFDDLAGIATVRKASGGAIPVMTKYRPTMDFDDFLRRVSPNAVEIDADEVTAELCRKFHRAGVIVQAKVLGPAWDHGDTWRTMIDHGVDWLQTDDPAGLLTTAGRMTRPDWPVMVAHHRGANRYAPENTIPAILTSVALGADYVEIDVRATKDGHFVLMHDSTVDRTTSGHGAVRDLTLAEIRDLDAGAWFGKPFVGTHVPTLDEALAALGPRVAVYLDAKEIEPEAVLAAIQAHELFERHVVYQSLSYSAALKNLDPRLRPMPPLGSVADLKGVLPIKPYAVDAAWRSLSEDLVADCHRAGIRVFSDALGLHEMPHSYRQAMDMGIDVIQTDYPLRVLRAVELHDVGSS